MPASQDDLNLLNSFTVSAPTTNSQQLAPEDQSTLQQFSQTNQHTEAGKSWELADNNSPLSPLERGAFGWLKTASAKQKYLEGRFGKGDPNDPNVRILPSDGENLNFAVRDKTGIHQVDPSGLSDIPMDYVRGVLKGDQSKAAQDWANVNWHNTSGGVSQFIAGRGLESLGATAFGAMGSLFGPVGAAVGGAIGGGAGGMVSLGIRDGLDQLSKLTGVEIPGAEAVYGDEFHKQMHASIMFGAQQEAAAQFLKLGGKAAAGFIGGLMDRIGNTAVSRQAQASLLNLIGNIKGGFSRIVADSPRETWNLVPMAADDVVNRTTKVADMQDSLVSQALSDGQKALRGIGKQYEAIDRAASGHTFNALAPLKSGSNPLSDVIDSLKSEKYLDADGGISAKTLGTITPDTTGTNGTALQTLIQDYNTLAKKGSSANFKDLTIMGRKIDQFTSYGNRQVDDGFLGKQLAQAKVGIKNIQSQMLHEVDPDLSARLGDLDDKYGEAKDFLENFSPKAEDSKVRTFIKQIVRDDGSYNSKLVGQMSNLLGTTDPTSKILQLEAAKHLVPSFGVLRRFGAVPLPLPSTPRGAGAVAGNVLGPMQDVQSAITPATKAISSYMKKFHGAYQSLPSATRSDMMKTPGVWDAAAHMVTGAALTEDQTKNQLLQQSGAFQQSQMGQ